MREKLEETGKRQEGEEEGAAAYSRGRSSRGSRPFARVSYALVVGQACRSVQRVAGCSWRERVRWMIALDEKMTVNCLDSRKSRRVVLFFPLLRNRFESPDGVKSYVVKI
jgi:hypothetical protein